jgi:hypothetical protein
VWRDSLERLAQRVVTKSCDRSRISKFPDHLLIRAAPADELACN